MEGIKMNKILCSEIIIESVKKNPVTIIAVDRDGIVKCCIPLNEAPESIVEFNNLLKKTMKKEKKKEYAVSIIDQDKRYSLSKLLKKIDSSIEALQYAKKHPLKPGINIPGNKKYYSIKKKLAKKLRIKE